MREASAGPTSTARRRKEEEGAGSRERARWKWRRLLASVRVFPLLYCGLFRDLVPRFYNDLYVLRLVSFLYIVVLWRKGVFVVGTRQCGGFLLFFLFCAIAGFFLYYAISLRLASSINKIKKERNLQ